MGRLALPSEMTTITPGGGADHAHCPVSKPTLLSLSLSPPQRRARLLHVGLSGVLYIFMARRPERGVFRKSASMRDRQSNVGGARGAASGDTMLAAPRIAAGIVCGRSGPGGSRGQPKQDHADRHVSNLGRSGPGGPVDAAGAFGQPRFARAGRNFAETPLTLG